MPIFLTGVGANSLLVTYNGVDLTNHVRSVMITQAYDKVETTAMNAVNKAFAVGLSDASVDIEFYQDYAASSVDQTLSPFLGSSAGATLVIQTSGSTVNATNPKYTGVMGIFNYNAIDGQVGAASMTKVSFQCVSGTTLTRATS